MPRLRAYLELARISNAPTCVGNVLVGAAAAAVAAPSVPVAWGAVATAIVGVVLLYCGGMALNDVLDVEVDRRERPGRPIPSGRVGRPAAGAFAAFCLGSGWLLIALQGSAALLAASLLVAAIVLYDAVHRAAAASVIVMGLCRGLVYVVGAAATAVPVGSWHLVAWPAAGMSAYVVALSVVARREMSPVPAHRTWPPLVLPAIALIPLPALLAAGAGTGIARAAAAAIAALVLVAWLGVASAPLRREPPRVPRAVMGWLAGICLVDATWLAALGQGGAVAVAAAAFVATVAMQRVVAGS